MSNAHSTYKAAAERLSYCPKSGVFRWVNSRRVAGGICQQGYWRMKVDGVTIKGHRLAWFVTFGELPEMIDHINGIKSDNRIDNLRKASNAENQMNRFMPCSNNASGHLGVNFNKQANKYAARIQHNGKRIHIGYFDSPEDAANAYNQVKSQLTDFYPPVVGTTRKDQ